MLLSHLARLPAGRHACAPAWLSYTTLLIYIFRFARACASDILWLVYNLFCSFTALHRFYLPHVHVYNVSSLIVLLGALSDLRVTQSQISYAYCTYICGSGMRALSIFKWHALFVLAAGSVGYTMRDIRYKWNSGLKSVGISKEVELPQFRVLGHRQRATVINLTTGNRSKEMSSRTFLLFFFCTLFCFKIGCGVRCLSAASTGLWLQSVTPCGIYVINGTKVLTQ